ncbi:MAG: pyridoxal 5'-phosphate synthase glutaminase subunit PdxT, partial [Berryella intestinalis]|nr:pyridoxal 5'-phosphate synthase glutaminase subunit PdxT [Berryella intestinalis]
MTVGILAVQGAFAEHRKKMEALGAPVVEIRQAGDLDLPFDRLILPGGESTVQRRLVHEDGLFEGLRK